MIDQRGHQRIVQPSKEICGHTMEAFYQRLSHELVWAAQFLGPGEAVCESATGGKGSGQTVGLDVGSRRGGPELSSESCRRSRPRLPTAVAAGPGLQSWELGRWIAFSGPQAGLGGPGSGRLRHG